MKEYEVEHNGVKTTLLLSDEDAEAQGLKGGKKVADDVSAQSERGPDEGTNPNATSAEGDAADSKKAKATANKARKSTSNK